MRCAAALAYDSENENSRKILPEHDCISVLEKEIDKMEEILAAIEEFHSSRRKYSRIILSYSQMCMPEGRKGCI